MPARTPKACRTRGCRNTTIDPGGYCDEHKGEGWKRHRPGLTRTQRGYGPDWDRRRAVILKRDRGLCQQCLRRGTITEANTVDHIVSKSHGGSDREGNLESLCTPCHRVKTATEGHRRPGGGEIPVSVRLPDCPPHRIFTPAKYEI